jgi:hypothetical protein
VDDSYLFHTGTNSDTRLFLFLSGLHCAEKVSVGGEPGMPGIRWIESVMSSLDPHGTCNVDKDGGLSRPRRHGLELVRWSETRMSEWMPEWMSEQSWMARVRIIMRTRMEVRTGSESMGLNM